MRSSGQFWDVLVLFKVLKNTFSIFKKFLAFKKARFLRGRVKYQKVPKIRTALGKKFRTVKNFLRVSQISGFLVEIYHTVFCKK